MPEITYDRYCLSVDGQRVSIRSAALHYFRLPGETMWRDRLFKLKAAGYNTIDLYFPWSYHSPTEGEYDFTGIRDVERLFAITRELGLWVTARPGPYVNAELSGGGLPHWLIARHGTVLRNRHQGAHHWDENYMNAVRQWWEHIVPIIARQSNVILFQVENEYATEDMNPDYLATLVRWSRELGITVPTFHNDMYAFGCFAEEVDIYAFDHYPVMEYLTDWRHQPGKALATVDSVEQSLRPYCENRPLFVAELQSGWFTPWFGTPPLEIVKKSGRELIRLVTKSLLGQGLTMFNHYMGVGGTNWGYLGSTDSITSYDFAALVGEDGSLRPSYFEAKAINHWLQAFPMDATERVNEAEPTFTLSDPTALYAIRRVVDGLVQDGDENAQPQASWIFLRNLTLFPRTVQLDGHFVLLPALDVVVLPWQLPLKAGPVLTFASTELLYQDEQTLIVKGDRPVRLALQQRDGSCEVVEFKAQKPDQWQVRAVGGLTVMALGARRMDEFWVDAPQAQGDRLLFGVSAWMGPDRFAGIPGKAATIITHRQGETQQIELTVHEAPLKLEVPELSDWDWQPYAVSQDSWRAIEIPAEPAVLSLDLDHLGIYEGTVCYRMSWPVEGEKPARIKMTARHLWQMRLGDYHLGQNILWVAPVGATQPITEVLVEIPAKAWEQGQMIELLVDFLGHPKGFFDDAASPGGLLGFHPEPAFQPATIEVARVGLPGPTQGDRQLDSPSTTVEPVLDLWQATAEFVTPVSGGPLQVRIPDGIAERINLVLNGTLVGRYWATCRTQSEFYLPSGLLGPVGQRNRLTLLGLPFDQKSRRACRPKSLKRVGLQWAIAPVTLLSPVETV